MAKKSALEFFKQLKEDIPKIEKKILNTIIKVEANNHFAENFRTQSWEENKGHRTKWEKRKKDKTTPTEANKLPFLLTKNGDLKRLATNGEVEGNSVVFRVNLPYAKIHNEGGTETFTQDVKTHTRTHYKSGKPYTIEAHTRTITRTMPKRQYIGDSPALDKRITTKIDELIKKRMKP
jgi:phage gpG-like protein